MLNKNEFINMLNEQTGKTKKDIGESVDMVLEGIKKAYRDYDGVKFVGFGTFTKKKTKTRIGTNPNTLEPIKIQSNVLPKFIPGRELKELLV